MEQDTKSIKAAITKNYLLSIVGGGGGVALLILLYLLKPFPDFGLKSALYLSALTFLMAMWIAVWVIIMQTTVSLERLIKESQNVEQESEKIFRSSLLKAIQRLEEKSKNLDQYCRQVVVAAHVHDVFITEMDIRDWQALLDEKTWSLNVNTKIRNQLVRADIWTIRQLVSISVSALVERTGMGEISLQKLRDALHSKCRYLHLELLYVDQAGPEYLDHKEPLLSIFDETTTKEEER